MGNISTDISLGLLNSFGRTLQELKSFLVLLLLLFKSRDYLSRGVCVLCVFCVCSMYVLCVFYLRIDSLHHFAPFGKALLRYLGHSFTPLDNKGKIWSLVLVENTLKL